MRKKILVVTDNLRDQVNGVVTTYKNIETRAILDGYSVVYIDPGQFHYLSCPGYPEVKLSWPYKVGEKIKEMDPDHIHIATEGPLGVTAKLYCDRNRYKYTTAYHTKFPEFLKKIYRIPEWITYRFVRWFHYRSVRVLTTTQTMVDDLRSHGFNGYIVPWTRGVDRDLLKPTINHKKNSNPTLLYVGRVSKEKNIEDLCRLQDRYDIEIVGDGPHREYLYRNYPRVKFLGYQQGSELANSYSRADVFVFPSRTDTFGIVIIEALAMGTPVAAYPVPGPTDIIDQGITGSLNQDLEQAIEICLKLDRDRVQEASQRWTWEKCWKIFKHNLINKS